MDDRIISACGLVCSECPAYLATRKGDAVAVQRVAAQWSEQFGHSIPPQSVWCDGCMTGGERVCGHAGECEIRACVAGRGLSDCAGCGDFVCGRLERFLTMAADSGARETLESLRAR